MGDDAAVAEHAHERDAAFEDERRHFCDVLRAFRHYRACFEPKMRRRQSHFAAVLANPSWRALCHPDAERDRGERLQAACNANQRILDMIADAQEASGFGTMFLGSAPPETDMGDAAHPRDGAAAAASSPTPATGPRGAATASSVAQAAPSIPPLSRGDELGLDTDPRALAPFEHVSASHASKVRSCLHSLARDWSTEGKDERNAVYVPILDALRKSLPITAASANKQRVCIPGAGLGRLVFDAAAAGYAAQGNDFDFFMLFTSHWMLNASDGVEAYVVYPWIHDASNHVRGADMLRPVRVPDVAPSSLLEINPGADMSMTAGEFVQIYSAAEHDGAWDGVAMSFFVDTAAVAFEYIDTVYHMLRPGGVWVCAGPLTYHWQSSSEAAPDARFGRSVELTYAELRYAIDAKGFKITRESNVRTTYASDAKSLLRPVYSCVLFTAEKPRLP